MSRKSKSKSSIIAAPAKRTNDTEAIAPIDSFVQRITSCWQNAVESIIETGRLLVKAKDELDHGQFSDMIEDRLPFGSRTAQMLMRIASHPIIANPKHVSHLPPSWGTLHELTKLPIEDDAFEGLIADGTINPQMERKDVTALHDKTTRDGIFWHSELWDCLHRLSRMTRKDVNPVTLAMFLRDADEENGSNLDSFTLDAICQFVDRIRAAMEGREFDGVRLENNVGVKTAAVT